MFGFYIGVSACVFTLRLTWVLRFGFGDLDSFAVFVICMLLVGFTFVGLDLAWFCWMVRFVLLLGFI